MINKKIEIKNKLTNHIMINGEKKTSEKILLKSFKELQKKNKKQSKNLFQLAIIYSTPVFKLHKISNKKLKKKKGKIKEIPAFIASTSSRTSLSIKFILESLKKRKTDNFYLNLKQEVVLASQSKSAAVELKNNLQKQILVNKRLFKFYRWK